MIDWDWVFRPTALKEKKMNNYQSKLADMHACSDAIEWLEEQRFPTLQDAWDACERGDWMLWLIGRTTNHNDEAQLRKLTLAKARCAKLVIHLMKDERSRNAVEVAERFGLGEATRQELDAAASSAYVAATNTASASAYASADTGAAAYFTAAAAADAADACKNMLARCADEIRTVYPAAPKLKSRE
jgi:hypothetical protein